MVMQFERAADLESGQWQGGVHHDLMGTGVDGISGNRRFAMCSQAGRGLSVRRATEDVETQVVAHDAGQLAGIGADPKRGMSTRIEL